MDRSKYLFVFAFVKSLTVISLAACVQMFSGSRTSDSLRQSLALTTTIKNDLGQAGSVENSLTQAEGVLNSQPDNSLPPADLESEHDG